MTNREDSTMSRSVQEVSTLLENIYFNGSEQRRGLRIERTTLRELFQMQRLEAATLAKLHDELRLRGFLLFPLDTDNYKAAQIWLLGRAARLEQWPIADNAVIQRAEQKAMQAA